jgi:hypothetical protein
MMLDWSPWVTRILEKRVRDESRTEMPARAMMEASSRLELAPVQP